MLSNNIKELDSISHYDNILSCITIFDNTKIKNIKKRKKIIVNNNKNTVLKINCNTIQQFINMYYD